MSLSKNNSLAILLGAMVFSVAVLQGCSEDEQAGPGAAGAAGSAGNKPSAGNSGKPEGEGGSGGEPPVETAGMGGETTLGGAGGEGPGPVDCDLSFPNNTLEAITDNGGELPELP